jgi:pimeloyl-ACP methyl ester carboxylesterase
MDNGNLSYRSGRIAAMKSSDVIMLKGGRRAAVHLLADGNTGRTVVLCHPDPGSGVFDPGPEATWSRGVTMIGVDRPGYGGSDPPRPGEWVDVGSAADELAEVLDQRGAEPVGVAGWAAGGLVAMALAARRADLVDRLVVVGTPAPDDEIAWLPPDVRAALDGARGLPPERARGALASLLSEGRRERDTGGADAAVIVQPGVRERLTAMMDAAFAQGTAGLVADVAGYGLRPWGFGPAEVKAKTLLMYGAKDPVAGPRHGKWFKARLPDARYEQVPGAGHLLIVSVWPRMLSHLAPRARR